MPSAVTLPTFSDEEILLYETLNAMSQAINARFLAGIGVADLSWPLTAEGNLNMSVFNITGGKQIWKFVNAGNYDTLQEALDDAGANGVVLVPPETTVPAATAGHALANAVTIVGAGVSSVIQMPSGASADMLRVSGGTGGGLYNVTLDGNSVAGGYSGASLTGATNYVISNVWTTGFTGSGIEVTSGMISMNVDGFNSTSDATSMTCTGCENLNLNNLRLKGYTSKGLDFNGGGSALRVHASNIHTATVSGGEGISFLGNAAVGVGSGAEFHGTNIHIKGAAGTTSGAVFGSLSAALDRVELSNSTIEDATDNGLVLHVGRGQINGVDIDSPTATGIYLGSSTLVTVTGGLVTGATLGIDAADITGACRAIDVDFSGCTANITGSANFRSWGCTDVLGANGEASMFNVTEETVTVSGGAASVMTMSIPAYTLRTGSVMQLDVTAATTGNDQAHALAFYLNGVALSSLTVGGGGSTVHRMTGTILMKSATTASSQYSLINGDGTAQSNYSNGITGLDATAAQNIEVHVTPAGGTGTDGLIVRNFSVVITQGRAYS